MAQRRQAICSARGIGDDVHGGFVVFRVVDTHDQSFERTFARGRDDDLAGTSVDVALRLLRLDEETCRFVPRN